MTRFLPFCYEKNDDENLVTLYVKVVAASMLASGCSRSASDLAVIRDQHHQQLIQQEQSTNSKANQSNQSSSSQSLKKAMWTKKNLRYSLDIQEYSTTTTTVQQEQTSKAAASSAVPTTTVQNPSLER